MTVDEAIIELIKLKKEGIINGETELFVDVWDGGISILTQQVLSFEVYKEYNFTSEPHVLKIQYQDFSV